MTNHMTKCGSWSWGNVHKSCTQALHAGYMEEQHPPARKNSLPQLITFPQSMSMKESRKHPQDHAPYRQSAGHLPLWPAKDSNTDGAWDSAVMTTRRWRWARLAQPPGTCLFSARSPWAKQEEPLGLQRMSFHLGLHRLENTAKAGTRQ